MATPLESGSKANDYARDFRGIRARVKEMIIEFQTLYDQVAQLSSDAGTDPELVAGDVTLIQTSATDARTQFANAVNNKVHVS